MSESEGKRVRRSAEERAAEIDTKVEALRQSITDQETKKQEAVAAFDEKIASIRERIKAMEAKKKEILAPKQPRKRRKSKKQKLQEIVQQAQKSGLKPEEIAELLGIQLEE